MVSELSFVAYFVRDVPAAVRFYRDVVGLRPGELQNDDWFEFDLGNCTFALDGSGEAMGITPGTSVGAAFEVTDIEEMHRRFDAAGVQLTPIYEFPPCHAFFAMDPEGNRFTMHRRKRSA